MNKYKFRLTCLAIIFLTTSHAVYSHDAEYFESVLRDGVCPRKLVKYHDKSFSPDCDNLTVSETLACQDHIQHLNNLIYKYNDFIEQCVEKRNSADGNIHSRLNAAKKAAVNSASVNAASAAKILKAQRESEEFERNYVAPQAPPNVQNEVKPKAMPESPVSVVKPRDEPHPLTTDQGVYVDECKAINLDGTSRIVCLCHSFDPDTYRLMSVQGNDVVILGQDRWHEWMERSQVPPTTWAP